MKKTINGFCLSIILTMPNAMMLGADNSSNKELFAQGLGAVVGYKLTFFRFYNCALQNLKSVNQNISKMRSEIKSPTKTTNISLLRSKIDILSHDGDPCDCSDGRCIMTRLKKELFVIRGFKICGALAGICLARSIFVNKENLFN